MSPISALAKLAHSSLYPSAFFNPSILNSLNHFPTTYSVAGLRQWYSTSDPMHPALLFMAIVSFLVWGTGELTGNVSQVDRLWTFLPVIYSAHFTFFPKVSGTGELDERMLIVFGLQMLWSIRLTRNTYIRGFFNPSTEDYRWEFQKQKMSWLQWKLLNIYFISIMQNMLLGAAQLPQYLLLTLTKAYSPNFVSPPVGIYDYALIATFIVILILETIGDVQQQRYQVFKAKAKASKVKLSAQDQGKLTRGFITDGLWAYSRHPNFACEQSTWYILYLFTIIPYLPQSGLSINSLTQAVLSVSSFSDVIALGRALQGTLWNYSIWAPLTMSMLFYGSTDLTEEISNTKYPLYKQYQRRVAEFWPFITTLKGIYLFVVGSLGTVNNIVYGSAAGQKKSQ